MTTQSSSKPSTATAGVEESIQQLVSALVASKGWVRAYADGIVRDAIDRGQDTDQISALNQVQLAEVVAGMPGGQDGFLKSWGWLNLAQALDEKQRVLLRLQIARGLKPEPTGTPAATWREAGEPDPHDNLYNGERAALCMGDLTDDELANGVYLHGDGTYGHPSPERIIAGLAHMPIAWLTAAKERIRWLSRALVRERERGTARTVSILTELRDQAKGDFEGSSSPGYKIHDLYRMRLDGAIQAVTISPSTNGGEGEGR